MSLASLVVSDKEALVQIDGKAYKIPGNVNLIERYRDNEEVMKRTIELARQYGTNFNGFDEGINCIECAFTKLFSIAEKEGGVVHQGGPRPCFYSGNTDYVLLFEGKRRGILRRKSKFMAKDFPCTVKDAFHKALKEQGYLDEFLLKDAVADKFYSIRDFEPGSELEKQASKYYATLSK